MRPLIIKGHVWWVIRVHPDDPFLIDKTGEKRIATTDPITKIIRISTSVPIRSYDQVYLHEAAHAIMEEYGVPDLLSRVSDDQEQLFVEEMLAWFLEHHGIEVIDAVSRSLGRPACVNDMCLGGSS